MIKTVGNLIEALDDIMDKDLPVMLWEQPHYPIEYSIDGVEIVESNGRVVVYIAEGHQEGYAPRLD